MTILSTLFIAMASAFLFAAQPETLVPAGEQPQMFNEGVDFGLMKSSPEFSYAAAETTFAAARVPAPDELIGKWLLIGQASDPKYGETSTDGYWPDGKFKAPGWGTGYFKVVAALDPFRDAFGATSLTWTHRLIGMESGKIYYKKGPSVGAFNATGFHFDLEGTDSVCRSEVECRVVQTNGMLLCQLRSVDRRSECKRTRASNYSGMTKLPN